MIICSILTDATSTLLPLTSNFTGCQGDKITFMCNVSGNSLMWQWQNSFSSGEQLYISYQRQLGKINTTTMLNGVPGVTTTLIDIDSANTYIASSLQFFASANLLFANITCNNLHRKLIFKGKGYFHPETKWLDSK